MKMGIHEEGAFRSIVVDAQRLGSEPTSTEVDGGQLEELILQLVEHELGSVDVYATALLYARGESLREEWQLASQDSRTHLDALVAFCELLGFDVRKETAGRVIVRHIGVSLVEAMNMSVTAAHPATTELVACECVLIAETKAQFGWELLARCTERFDLFQSEALRQAYSDIANAAKEKFFRARGRCHRTWLESLGVTGLR